MEEVAVLRVVPGVLYLFFARRPFRSLSLVFFVCNDMNIVQYIACGRTTMIELVSALVAVRIVPENDCSQSRL